MSTLLTATTEIAFLLLDGVKRQRPGGGSDAALCALGLTRDGYARPLMMRVVPAEQERAWRSLLVELRTEGLGPDLLLIGSDGHPALIKAIQATYPETPLQICVAHRLLSLARKVDARWRSECLAGARRIFAAGDRVTAVGLFREWHTQWLKQGEPAVRTLEGDLAACLTFHRFPPHLWSRIRTVNLVERAFREARRSALPAAPASADEESHDAGADTTVEGTVLVDEAVPEEQTVLVVPAASNGHVTPELIGDLTMLPDEEPEQAEDTASPEADLPVEVLQYTQVVTPHLQAEIPAAVEPAPENPPPLPQDSRVLELPTEGPPESSEAEEPPSADPAAASGVLEERAEDALAWADADDSDEETTVWGPVDLASDEEFDRRLAAYHRYAVQMRVAVTLTSAAGLMAGVVLAFVR